MSAALNLNDLRTELSRSCESLGSQSAWARKHGFPVSQVCESISGRRDPSEAMINALGFVRVVRYIQNTKEIVHGA